jgi:MATE family, multidrug efflux pump
MMTIYTHIRQSWKLAYPVMLSQLGHVMLGVSDNIMVGHVDALSLAAAGLATVVFNVLLLFGIGVSFAITPLVASAHGEGDELRITAILRHGLIINFLNSLFLVAVVSIGKNLLHHLSQPPEVVALAIPYLSIITYSLVPMLIFQTFKQFADGLSQTKVSLMVIIGANVVNIFLNYIFIFGYGPVPAMGLTGAGWGTLCSRIFMMIAIAAYIYYSTFFKAFRPGFILSGFSSMMFREILNLGIPSGAQFIFEVAAFDFSLVMMGWIGTQTLAAHQIAINLATISYMTTSGLAATATIRVGYFLGKKDIKNLKMASGTLLAMALLIMTCWAILFIAGRHVLPLLYVDNVEVIGIASTLLVVAGLFQLADGTQVVCLSALRGLQDVRVPSLFIFIAYWIIGLPLGYWLTFTMDYGAVGIWLGLLTGLTLTAVAMFVRFRKLVGAWAVNA